MAQGCPPVVTSRAVRLYASRVYKRIISMRGRRPLGRRGVTVPLMALGDGARTTSDWPATDGL